MWRGVSKYEMPTTKEVVRAALTLLITLVIVGVVLGLALGFLLKGVVQMTLPGVSLY